MRSARRYSERWRWGALAAAALALSAVAAAGTPEPEGKVRFYNVADSDFDVYSLNPSPAQQQWMQDHYVRMQTYSPYFDQRLSWYPDAWVYKDSYAIKPHWPEFTEHPEWVLHDALGNLLYIPWGCSGGTCPQFAADIGNPEFRAHWIAQAKAKIDLGYRGIWVDDVNLTWRISDGLGNAVRPVDPRTGEQMTLDDWRRYFAEFMEELRAAIPDAEIAHNAIWYAGPLDDAYIRRQIQAADYYNLERGAWDNGLTGGGGTFGFETWLAFIDAMHGLGTDIVMMDWGTTAQERDYGLAAWFLVSQGADLMNNIRLQHTAPDTFWAGYALDLGEALGERQAWAGVLRRNFQCGIVLLNEPGMPTRTLALDAPHTTIDGDEVESVTLVAKSAAILLHECVASAVPMPPSDVTVE